MLSATFDTLNRMLHANDDSVWKIYFENQFRGEEIKNCQNCAIPDGKGEYYLKQCIFFDCSTQIINFNVDSKTSIQHNRCAFSNCSSNQKGCCIRFRSTLEASIVQRKFCCTKCQSQNEGQFSYVDFVRNSISNITEGSLFDLGKEDAGSRSIYSKGGNILVSSTNFSSSTTNQETFGHFEVIVNKFIKIDYTTAVNNVATNQDGTIISLTYDSDINLCNIINNTNKNSSYGIIYHNYNRFTVEICSFINNKSPENSCLIYVDRKSQFLIVSNNYIDKSIPKTCNAINVNILNPREPFTNKLIHFSTDFCQPEFQNINPINKTSQNEYFYRKLNNRRR